MRAVLLIFFFKLQITHPKVISIPLGIKDHMADSTFTQGKAFLNQDKRCPFTCICLRVCVSVYPSVSESAYKYECGAMLFCACDLFCICPRTRMVYCVRKECIWLLNFMGCDIYRTTTLMLAATSDWGARPHMLKCVQDNIGAWVSRQIDKWVDMLLDWSYYFRKVALQPSWRG